MKIYEGEGWILKNAFKLRIPYFSRFRKIDHIFRKIRYLTANNSLNWLILSNTKKATICFALFQRHFTCNLFEFLDLLKEKLIQKCNNHFIIKDFNKIAYVRFQLSIHTFSLKCNRQVIINYNNYYSGF